MDGQCVVQEPCTNVLKRLSLIERLLLATPCPSQEGSLVNRSLVRASGELARASLSERHRKDHESGDGGLGHMDGQCVVQESCTNVLKRLSLIKRLLLATPCPSQEGSLVNRSLVRGSLARVSLGETRKGSRVG